MDNNQNLLRALSPLEALQRIAGPRAGNRSQNHVGRDVSTLLRLGVRPEKICGRWVVRRGEIARWAAGHAQAEPELRPAQAKRGPGRPRKANGRRDVQKQNGSAP